MVSTSWSVVPMAFMSPVHGLCSTCTYYGTAEVIFGPVAGLQPVAGLALGNGSQWPAGLVSSCMIFAECGCLSVVSPSRVLLAAASHVSLAIGRALAGVTRVV